MTGEIQCMADSVTGFERTFDSASYSPVTGRDNGISDRNSRPPRPVADDVPRPDLESLLRLAATKQNAGEDAEAEEYFRQALAIADRTMGPDDPELMLLLTDLTRLHLRKSSFAAAEPLLLRLLEMKRSKGEDHPEVATVFASLANVRQALGHHESAEQLWRRVLDIRERTLAPNHFAIATALEHLGDSCAARGKIEEALSEFRRALSIRERTLGAEHPSLRISRERIADLQLLASENSLETGPSRNSLETGPSSEPAISPERYRLVSGESLALATQTPVHRERPATSVIKKPTVIVHGPFSDIDADNKDAPPPSEEPMAGFASPLMEAAAVGTASRPESLPYRDVLESLREELEKPYKTGAITERVSEMLGPVLTFLGKKQVIAAGIVIVLSLLLVGVVTNSHAFGESDQTTAFAAPASESPRIAPPAAIVSSPKPSSTPAAPTADASTTSKATPAHTRVVEERAVPSKKAPEKKAETKGLSLPTLSNAVLSRLDSVATHTSASAKAGEAIIVPAGNGFANRRSTYGESDPSTAPQRARLIGDLPTPRVPNQVADVEGEVRVRFSVDTNGSPVMSTVEVVTSPNPLLTAAVRKVIPGMRFEPARTGGPDAKPIADVVQIAFRFASAPR